MPEVRWIDALTLADLVDSPALLVVLREDEEEEMKRIVSVLESLKDDMELLFRFSIDFSGMGGEALIPVFFIHADDYFQGEQDETPLLVPLATPAEPLKGPDTWNPEKVRTLLEQIWSWMGHLENRGEKVSDVDQFLG